MNVRLVAVVAGLAVSSMAVTAQGTPIVFAYTGGFQTFTAPTTGVYHITSAGAQGGGAYGTTLLGGLGAMVGGDFELTQGEMLTILVGGMGGYGGPGNDFNVPPIGGGGGGGSFVYTPIVGTYGYTTALGQPDQLANTFTGYVQLADAGGGGGIGGLLQKNAAGGAGQVYGVGYGPGSSGAQSSIELAGSGAGYISSGLSGGGYSPGDGGQGGAFATHVVFGPDMDGHGGFGGGGSGGTGSLAAGAIGGGGGGGGYSGAPEQTAVLVKAASHILPTAHP